MTSLRQIEANRHNAQLSTGPRTDEGKGRSRRNALRHGLTAETVVDTLEDSEDYRAFEAAIIADYDARTAVERELVLRLASLLWRIRRATSIETDLLRIQAEILSERRNSGQEQSPPNLVYRVLRATIASRLRDHSGNGFHNGQPDLSEACDGINQKSESVDATRELTYCFLRLMNLDSRAFQRLSRYEATLWRQTVQTLFALRSVRCR